MALEQRLRGLPRLEGATARDQFLRSGRSTSARGRGQCRSLGQRSVVEAASPAWPAAAESVRRTADAADRESLATPAAAWAAAAAARATVEAGLAGQRTLGRRFRHGGHRRRLGGLGRTCGASGAFLLRAGVGVSIGAPSSGGIPLMMRGRRTSSAGFLSSATGSCPTPIDASRLASTAARKTGSQSRCSHADHVRGPLNFHLRFLLGRIAANTLDPGRRQARFARIFAAAQAYRFVAATGNKPIDGVAKRKHFGGTSHR